MQHWVSAEPTNPGNDAADSDAPVESTLGKVYCSGRSEAHSNWMSWFGLGATAYPQLSLLPGSLPCLSDTRPGAVNAHGRGQ